MLTKPSPLRRWHSIAVTDKGQQTTRRAAFPEGKACEARPVGETASRVWRRGQNIQGVCRRIFWVPQEYRGTAACGGGRGTTKNPEGNLLLIREVSPQVTEEKKSYPIKLSLYFIKNTLPDKAGTKIFAQKSRFPQPESGFKIIFILNISHHQNR